MLTTYFFYILGGTAWLLNISTTSAPRLIFFTQINKSYFPQLLQAKVLSLMYLLNYLASLMFSTHLICVYKCEYLCVCVFLSLSTYLSVCLFVYLPTHVYIYQCTNLSICLSIYLSFCLPVPALRV